MGDTIYPTFFMTEVLVLKHLLAFLGKLCLMSYLAPYPFRKGNLI